MSQLITPWGETIAIEDMERFSLDIMMLTAEYYVTTPVPHLIVVTSSDFVLEDDTFTVKACSVRDIELWVDEEDPIFDKVWKDFTSTELPRPN